MEKDKYSITKNISKIVGLKNTSTKLIIKIFRIVRNVPTRKVHRIRKYNVSLSFLSLIRFPFHENRFIANLKRV